MNLKVLEQCASSFFLLSKENREEKFRFMMNRLFKLRHSIRGHMFGSYFRCVWGTSRISKKNIKRSSEY